jgi:hypothetical protein
VLVALLYDPVDAIVVLVWIIIYQQIENYLLAPKLTARTMDVSAPVAFAAGATRSSTRRDRRRPARTRTPLATGHDERALCLRSPAAMSLAVVSGLYLDRPTALKGE